MNFNRFERQLALYGPAGQQIISESCIVISGANKLGAEIAKSASIFGTGNIYVIDNIIGRNNLKFLDLNYEDNKPRSKSLEEMISQHLNPDCNIKGIDAKVSKPLLSLLPKRPDVIIEASNKVREQEECLNYCRENRIPLITVAVSGHEGEVSYYNPNDENYDSERFKRIISNYEDKPQGFITSNLFSGIVMEEFRKTLFKSYVHKFKGNEVILEDGNIVDQSEKILKEKIMVSDIYYNINGKDRIKSKSNDFGLRGEGKFEHKNILLLGCGAVGNYVADIVARLSPKVLDVADFDVFVEHNLNRQPLAYGNIGNLKAKVLAERINNISDGTITSRSIIGYVGSCKDRDFREKIEEVKLLSPNCGISKDNVTILDYGWFKSHQYDLVIGAIDSLEARKYFNSCFTELGIPYIDTGTGPDSGRINIYVPKKTKCIECYESIDNLIKNKRDLANEILNEDAALAEQVSNLTGCLFEPGSVNMSNQIIAALAVAEARLITLGRYDLLVNKVNYYSNSLSKLQTSKNVEHCNCGKR
jgi:tRNA A37 threonylcarbamoyladenosine dehydratase